MTAFSLVMLGKLVFPVVFCCCCIITSESIVFSFFLIKKNIVLDVRRPKLFHFGGKKGRTRRATPA